MSFNITKFILNEEQANIRLLVSVELSVVVMVLAATTLAIFGSSRKRRNNAALKGIQWISYTLLTTILFSYTIGQMQSAQFLNELFTLWTISLLVLFGSVDSFSAFSLEDNDQWKKYDLEVSSISYSVGGIIGFYLAGTKYYWYVYISIFLFIFYKTRERIEAMCFATKSYLEKNTKLIADFMAREHEIGTEGEPDPTDIAGLQLFGQRRNREYGKSHPATALSEAGGH